MMEFWIKSNWIGSLMPLGWAIINSIWQSLLLYLTYKFLIGVFPKINTKVRYVLGLISLLSLFTLFLVGCWEGFYHYKMTKLNISNSIIAPIQDNAIYSQEPSMHSSLSRPGLDIDTISNVLNLKAFLPALGLLYILCLFFMGFRLIGKLLRVKGLSNPRYLIKPDPFLENLFIQVQKKLNASTSIRLWLSTQTISPMAFGWIKPIVLFPLGLGSQLSISQIEGLIIHELAHLKRQDYFFNVLQNIIETLLFFNPLVWWLNTEIRIEREKICDDWVISNSPENSFEYASTLLSLEEGVYLSSLSLGAVSNKNYLLNRIERIMTKSKQTNPASYLISGIFTLSIGFISILLLSSAIANYPSSNSFGRTTLDTILPPKNKKLATIPVPPSVPVPPTIPVPLTAPVSPTAPVPPIVPVPPSLEPLSIPTPPNLENFENDSRFENIKDSMNRNYEFNKQIEDARKQALKAQKFIISPDFEREIARAEKKALKAQKSFNSKEFQNQIELAEKNALEAQMKFNSYDFQKQIDEAAKKAIESQKLFNSSEFQKKIDEAAKKAIEAQKLFNTGEFQKKIDKAVKKAQEAEKRVNSSQFKIHDDNQQNSWILVNKGC